jgi:hypothetical protein
MRPTMVALALLLAAVACSHERPAGSAGEPGSAVARTTETTCRGPLAVPARNGVAGRVVACTTPVTSRVLYTYEVTGTRSSSR